MAMFQHEYFLALNRLAFRENASWQDLMYLRLEAAVARSWLAWSMMKEEK